MEANSKNCFLQAFVWKGVKARIPSNPGASANK
jgi:hypothetical protein